jgi:uncharacterized protein YjbI with pentapeptide repeats
MGASIDAGPAQEPGSRAPATSGKQVIGKGGAGPMLRDHERWLASGGAEGARADFASTTCREVVFRGSLQQAKFQGAVLEGCTFEPGTDLAEADFSEANLTGVDFTGTCNLAEHRLGASKLSYARLPDGFEFKGLETVKDTAARAEKILYAVMATCATVVVLTRVIPHHQLFQPTQAINLPVLGLPVPVRTFFNLTPWLLLVLYAYLLSTLHKLWAGMRDLPAILPSHRLLFREIPASPNFCVMPFGWCWRTFPHRNRSEAEEAAQLTQVTRLDRWLVVAMVWWLVPATLAWLWLAYLPRHSAVDTRMHVAALGAGVALSLVSHGRMLEQLTRGMSDCKVPEHVRGPRPVQRKLPLGSMQLLLYTGPGAPAPAVTRRVLRQGTIAACIAVVILAAGITSHLAIRGGACRFDAARKGKERGFCYRLAANLTRADLGNLVLSDGNLRRAFLPGATLEETELEDTHLEGAQMSDVKGDGAKLKDAHLEGAVLWEAHLDSANLKEAHLEGADLRGAFLRGAALQGAHFAGADLRGADLAGAVVCGADFSDAKGWSAAAVDAHGTGISHATARTGTLDDAGSLPVPGYLDDEGSLGFVQWARAEYRVRQLARLVQTSAPTGRLPRQELLNAVDSVDVSMAASTQREQLALRAFIRGYGVGGTLPYVPQVRAQLAAFIETVLTKVRNHCVVPIAFDIPEATR